jgi:hypothetical protein
MLAPGVSMAIVYLTKADDRLVSHCACADVLVAHPSQAACPWCGCGWLFTCITCRKAFTFARGVEIDATWEGLAQRDLRTWSSGEEPDDDDVRHWVETMRGMLAQVEVGRTYVCLDGTVIPIDASRVAFEGWHSRHAFDFVPQVRALTDVRVREGVLGSRAYWRRTALRRW